MMHHDKVAILIATYNSSKYLREQLDSLYAQTHRNWVLYVRDDGSTDNTLDIVADYFEKYKNVILLKDERKNQGAKYSFMWLLEHVDCKYYMFCDHDDVWLPNKIELSLNKIKESELLYPDIPIIINTDLYVVDQNLNVISDSFWRYSNLNAHLLVNFNYLAVNYFVTGCTMLFNHKVKQIAFPIIEEIIMHDAWLSLITLAKGGVIIPIKQSTIYYRQHSNNVYGAKELVLDNGYYKSKIRNMHDLLRVYYTNCKTVNKIKKTSFPKYLFFKLLYLIRR